MYIILKSKPNESGFHVLLDQAAVNLLYTTLKEAYRAKNGGREHLLAFFEGIQDVDKT